MAKKLKPGEWSHQYNCCIDCQTIDHKHMGHGLCSLCYQRQLYISTPIELRKGKMNKALSKRCFGGNREEALQRDDYKCTICGNIGKRLAVHHIDESGKSENPNNELGNLQTLCQVCHTRLHRTGTKLETWAKNYTCCQGCGTTTKKCHGHGFCTVCYHLDRRVLIRKPMETWAKEYDCCQKCGTTEKRHGGNGLCRYCNNKRLVQLKKGNASL